MVKIAASVTAVALSDSVLVSVSRRVLVFRSVREWPAPLVPEPGWLLFWAPLCAAYAVAGLASAQKNL